MSEPLKVVATQVITKEGILNLSPDLLPDELLKRAAELGEAEDVSDPIVIARFYHPGTTFTWFMMSYDAESQNMFCYASLFHDHNDELGYTHIPELVEVGGAMRISDWVEKPLSEAKKEAGLS